MIEADMNAGTPPSDQPGYIRYGDSWGVIVSNDTVEYTFPVSAGAVVPCEVYWGSHGCMLERGHADHCRCDCADDDTDPDVVNVGAYPYYGDTTVFYGEDAVSRWGRGRVYAPEGIVEIQCRGAGAQTEIDN